MKTIGLALLLAGATSSSSIASGMIDYDWGLSPSEVAAHSGGKAPEGSSSAWVMGAPYTLGNVGTVTVMGEEMEAGFYYVDDGLAQVRALKREPCPAMRETLKAKFGKPTNESEFSSGYSGTWIDAASATEITHIASGECRVFFKHIE